MKRFEDFTYEDAAREFVALDEFLKRTESFKEFIEGDDWQSGAAWNGPNFEKADEIGKNLKKETERVFTSKGDLRAVTRRHRRGVIGRTPTWNITPRNAPADPDEISAADNSLIAEAQKILNEFWKNSQVHKTLKKHVSTYLGRGHSILRPYFVQRSSSSKTGKLARLDSIEKAVKFAHLFYEEPESGCIIWNRETLERASLYRYSFEGVNYIEMCWIDEKGMTVFKSLSETVRRDFNERNFPHSLAKYDTPETREEIAELRLNLGGKLLLSELSGEPFVTEAMASQQKNVNKSFTMMSYNLDIDGFRSRLLTNTMPPGDYQTIDGKKVFVPDKAQVLTVGAGKVQYASGIPITEKETTNAGTKITTSLTTPGVHESEPIDPTVFIKSAEASASAILEDADQIHVALSGDIAIAAESMRERREDYKMSLEDTKSDLDESLSETFETILAIVAYLMGQAGRYDSLQVTFSAILNPGPVSPEDRRMAIEESEKKYRTRESAMEHIGITDPDAMKAAIAKESENAAE